MWRSVNIEGFEHYVVSVEGEILNTKTRKPIKGWLNAGGYRRIWLCKNGEKRKFYLHRIVALTFVQNPMNHPEVDHLNRNTDDNRAVNLEWVEGSENLKRRQFKKQNKYAAPSVEEDLPF